MNDRQIDKGLPLKDLSIGNFRGIKELSIPYLGRVTLLAGRNGVGKTSILEAIEVYATRAKYTVLRGMLNKREELSLALDEEGDNILETDWSSLFHGRDITENGRLSVGPRKPKSNLALRRLTLANFPMKKSPVWEGGFQSLFCREKHTH